MNLKLDPKLNFLRSLIPDELTSLQDVHARTGLSESQLAEAVSELTRSSSIQSMPAGDLVLTDRYDLIDPDRVYDLIPLNIQSRISQLVFYAVCESTSTEATNLSPPPMSLQFNVVFSEFQTGGRGRRGRAWNSGFAGGICFTVAQRIPAGKTVAPTLTLSVGMQLAQVLDHFLNDTVLLKWPNDLILGDGKLGGILTELSTLDDGDQLLRIGVGVNVAVPDTSTMSGEVPALAPAGMQAAALGDWNRSDLAGALVSGVIEGLDTHDTKGFENVRSAWKQRDYLLHQSVKVFDNDRVRHGTAAGIDEHGALVVKTDEGEIKLMGGEVRVRRD